MTMVRQAKTHALTVRFTEEEHAALHAIAEAEDISAGAVVRRAVREYLDQRASEKKKPKK
jgi:predicted transcriptional regulator